MSEGEAAALSRNSWKRSAGVLLATSFISIALAMLLSWNLFEVVVLYWIQAFIYGVFQSRKIHDMVSFYNRANPEPRPRKYQAGSRVHLLTSASSRAFLLGYGVFWLGLGVLLLVSYASDNGLSVNSLTVLLAVLVQFASHLFSYRQNKSRDQRRLPAGMVAMMPFIRMLMPLLIFTMTVGYETDYGRGGVLVWMLMKTAVDLGAHAYEHSQPPVHG